MRKTDSQYLEKIIGLSDTKLRKEFSFSKFDSINIYLVTQVLNKNKHLWFEVNRSNLVKFYQSVLFAVAVDFFKKNYQERDMELPQVGDKYKSIKTKQVWQIENFKQTEERGVYLKCIGKKYKNATSQINLKDLNEKYSKQSKTVTSNNRQNIQPMLDFVKKTLGGEEQIRLFPYKFAIIMQKNELNKCFIELEKSAFPHTYVADSGHEAPHTPIADFMFYVTSSYETIQNYVFDRNITLETIVFIGNKYNHQIQQDIDREYFKQAIFIGDEKPDVKCLKWLWTLPEYQYFENLTLGTIEIIKIENAELTRLTRQFTEHIEQLEADNYIDLKKLYPYVSYVYALIMPIGNSRLQNRIDDLLFSFKKKSQQVLGEAFSGIGLDEKATYNQLFDIYLKILEQCDFKNNAKTQALTQLKEPDCLLVPERQTLTVWQTEIKKINWQKVEVISMAGLKKLDKAKNIIALSLENKQQFDAIKNTKHHIKWLLYDKEHKCYENLTVRYDNELIKEYQSKDRKQLTGVNYSDEVMPESIDELVDRFFDNTTSKGTYVTTYQDHIDKKITFDDNSDIELSANSTIILVDNNNETIKYKVVDLRVNDKIRVYENQHKEILFNIIINHDENNKFNEILKHSKLWKKILTDYCANDKTTKIKEIAILCDVAYSTVDGWLKNSNTKFPKNIKPLKDILGDNYFIIYKNNKRYNSIMIALGRDLSDEVSDYIISKQKGKLLNQFDDNTIKTISNSNMPIKSIKKIAIIE